MELWKYKYFVDVVEMKSFTKAGKKNFVTQTAVSRQIADLEKKIGGQLISRESGSLEVTELGQIVYDRAKEMLRIDEQMQEEIQQVKDNYIIRIGVDFSINKFLWQKLQKTIDEYYSDNDFQLTKVSKLDGSRMLGEHIIDAYIGYGIEEKYRQEDVEELKISEKPIGVYVGKGTTIKPSHIISLEDLKGHARYGTDSYPCSVVQDQDERFRELCGKIIYVDNAEVMKLRVEYKDGYALVDSYYFSQCSGDIRLLADWDCPQCIRVYYRSNAKKEKLKDVLLKFKHIMDEP